MRGWVDVWNLILELMGRETIAIRILTGLGVAFVAVMALEGLRTSFFPRRVPKLAAPREPQEGTATHNDADAPMQAAWNPHNLSAAFVPRPVNREVQRRSSPQEARVLGRRKPS